MINSLQNLFQYTSLFSYSMLAITIIVVIGFLIKFFIELNSLFKQISLSNTTVNQIIKNEETATNKVEKIIRDHKNRLIFVKSMTSGLFLFSLLQDILKDEESN